MSLAWRDPWAREGEKAPWDLAVNQGPLGLERKETEVRGDSFTGRTGCSIPGSPGESGLVFCGEMKLSLPLELFTR